MDSIPPKVMNFNTWLAFLGTMFFVSATPGPNMLLALHHGLRFGFQKSMATMAGMLISSGIIMSGSMLGLGAVLATSPRTFSVIQYIGACYLIYLGVKSWRAKVSTDSIDQENNLDHTEDDSSFWDRFKTGLGVGLSNPKAFIFFAALFPQFIDPKADQLTQFLVLAISFYVIEFSWQCVYAAGGGAMQHWLHDPKKIQFVNRLSGVVFILTGLALGIFAQQHG